MTATAAGRAERRYRQLLARGAAADLAALTVDLEERDRRDRQRAEAPLKPADDARILDTSDMGIDEVVQRKLFKNPRCQAGWNKNVLFGFS